LRHQRLRHRGAKNEVLSWAGDNYLHKEAWNGKVA
jgi:hypothetical protein